MRAYNISRRGFLGTMAAAPIAAQDRGWVELFNGRSLEGWRPQGNLSSWSVSDGLLRADGPMCHLFYEGPAGGADFRNFELEAEVMTRPHCNSGIYFHTVYQDTGWPGRGFEVQINNTQPGEWKKTASLYNLRNIYRQYVADDEWFRIRIQVSGKRVEVWLNGMKTVDYLEPTPAWVPANGMEKERHLGHGTIALQCHDVASKVAFRSVRVRPLPDVHLEETSAPDTVLKRILDQGSRGVPMLDLHVHPKGGLSVEAALAKSLHDGIQYGLAVNCGQGQPVTTDVAAHDYIASLKGLPVFAAMQAEGREWVNMFSRRAVAEFDYVFTDSMTWTDSRGKRMRTWIPEEVGTIADPQEFMDTLVDRAVGILQREPVDIYVNPTYLPDAISKDYESLWTEARRRKVIEAAVQNGVAIEINNRYKLPSASFIKMAKQAGCRFTFGTNNSGPADLGRCEYALDMVEECKLAPADFWVPLAPGSTKAVERKGEILKKA
ncbi:MAG TPA: family 16 glycoside hydrolase [Bryobacteraceae bacterium]|nr:family 16 glycoside hydrolase [Bryobacteraceae bacterium]